STNRSPQLRSTRSEGRKNQALRSGGQVQTVKKLHAGANRNQPRRLTRKLDEPEELASPRLQYPIL
ncbi:hypothetical protein U1Q18_036504, partial [Sarracenia purpurea var. burkii]